MTNDSNTHDRLAEPLADVIAAALDSDTTVCTRVWEAWSYGTMGPDDFTPLAEEPDSLRNIADAVLAAGYRKPRTISTAEELDAAIVRAFEEAQNLVLFDGWRPWIIWENDQGDTRVSSLPVEDDPAHLGLSDIPLPVTVMHSPEAAA